MRSTGKLTNSKAHKLFIHTHGSLAVIHDEWCHEPRSRYLLSAPIQLYQHLPCHVALNKIVKYGFCRNSMQILWSTCISVSTTKSRLQLQKVMRLMHTKLPTVKESKMKFSRGDGCRICTTKFSMCSSGRAWSSFAQNAKTIQKVKQFNFHAIEN